MLSISALVQASEVLRSFSRQLHSDLITPADAEGLLPVLLSSLQAQQAMINCLGVRACDGGAPRRAGFSTDGPWFGHQLQIDATRANRGLFTARTLADEDGEAFSAYCNGQLSDEQALAIATTISNEARRREAQRREEQRRREEQERLAREREAQRLAEEASRRRQGEAGPEPEPEPPVDDPPVDEPPVDEPPIDEPPGPSQSEIIAELLAQANAKRLSELKERAKAAARAQRERLNNGRRQRHCWTKRGEDHLVGGFRLGLAEGELLESLMAHYQPQVLERYKAESKASGLPIDWGKLRADVFAEILRSAQGSGGDGPNSVITYNVDIRINQDGSVEYPETWIMNGVVNLPADVADALASDPLLRLLFSLNGKLTGIGNDRPEISGSVTKAMLARSRGNCETPHCQRLGRERHHQLPRYRGGLGTDVTNILHLCWNCHQLITYDGFLLIGPPEDLYWLKPNEAIPERYQAWFGAYEARATTPAKVLRQRRTTPSEQRQRGHRTNLRAANLARVRAERNDEEGGETQSRAWSGDRSSGDDPAEPAGQSRLFG